VDSSCPDMVCRLNKSLYGLKQAPRAWYSLFDTFLLALGFVEAKSQLLQRIITSLQQEFAMKDLGQLHHFLGVTVEPRQTGLLLHQCQYALNILKRVGMTDCKPCSTPVDTQAKLSATLGDPVADPTAIGVLLAPYSTSLSPGRISHTLSSRSASICMIHGSHILLR
jgi:hypothetical protein